MTDRLNEQQCATISRGYCPDCSHNGFRIGPRGGPSLNIECMQCRSRFNVLHVSGAVAMADRIGPGSDWPTSIHGIHIVQAIVALLPDSKAEGLEVLDAAKRMVERFKR
jgi:hypothetical protein